MAPDYLLPRHTLQRMALYLAVAALAIAALGAWTDVDLNLANAMYDRAHQAFPWRHTWFAEQFSHEIMKKVLLLAGSALIFAALVDLLRPFASWTRLFRLQMRILATAAAAVPLVTSMLKRASASHCPWDLSQYGGDQPYVRLFDALPHGVLAGHCLPAGHAASALWLVAIGVFWLPGRPGRALAMSAAGLAAGVGLGWVQQMRGAHFLTHTLWSTWIACAVTLGLIALAQGLAALADGTSPWRKLFSKVRPAVRSLP
jgi:membrane-associated PAP2 superfamily phosphatase